jgi:hypothetical protein
MGFFLENLVTSPLHPSTTEADMARVCISTGTEEVDDTVAAGATEFRME